MVSHQLPMSGGQRSSSSRNITNLICYMTMQNQLIKESYDFMEKAPYCILLS